MVRSPVLVLIVACLAELVSCAAPQHARSAHRREPTGVERAPNGAEKPHSVVINVPVVRGPCGTSVGPFLATVAYTRDCKSGKGTIDGVVVSSEVPRLPGPVVEAVNEPLPVKPDPGRDYAVAFVHNYSDFSVEVLVTLEVEFVAGEKVDSNLPRYRAQASAILNANDKLQQSYFQWRAAAEKDSAHWRHHRTADLSDTRARWTGATAAVVIDGGDDNACTNPVRMPDGAVRDSWYPVAATTQSLAVTQNAK